MNPEVILSQTPMPQIPEFCDTLQIRQEENLTGETYTKHNKITLANLTTKFMVDKLHSVNKSINLIKNNMNNGQTKRNLLFYLTSINKTATTDKNIVPWANGFSNLIFDDTDDLESDTDVKEKRNSAD